MTRSLYAVAAAAVCVSIAAPRAQEPSFSDLVQRRVGAAASVLSEIAGAEQTIPRAVLEKAEAIAVFPYEAQRRGQRGEGPTTRRLAQRFRVRARGVASVRTANGWSAPVLLAITGGVPQSADLVLVATSRRGVEQLIGPRFELENAAVGSAALGASTAPSPAAADTTILVFARPRATMPASVVEGAVVEADRDAIRAFYGRDMTGAQVAAITDPPPAAGAWRAALEKHVRP